MKQVYLKAELDYQKAEEKEKQETENKFWTIKAVKVQKLRMLECLPGIMRQLYDCDVMIQGEAAPSYTVADEVSDAQSRKQEKQGDDIDVAEKNIDEQAEFMGQDVNSPDGQWEIALCYFHSKQTSYIITKNILAYTMKFYYECMTIHY